MSEKSATTPPGTDRPGRLAVREKKKTSRKRRSKTLPPYHVVLLNDDDHTYEYVVEMLKALFGHPVELGMTLAKRVDSTGRAIVFTGHKEYAELKRDQIHGYGMDWRIASCAGSMSARIEQAPG